MKVLPVAPPTDATLGQLTDPTRRPPQPYRPLSGDLLEATLQSLPQPRSRGYTAEVLRLALNEVVKRLICAPFI